MCFCYVSFRNVCTLNFPKGSQRLRQMAKIVIESYVYRRPQCTSPTHWRRSCRHRCSTRICEGNELKKGMNITLLSLITTNIEPKRCVYHGILPDSQLGIEMVITIASVSHMDIICALDCLPLQ